MSREFMTIHEQIGIDREHLRRALYKRELAVDLDDNGYIYEKSTDNEINDYVMNMFAEYAYQWQQANDCACVLEDLLSENKVKYSFRDFQLRMSAKAAQRYNPEEDDD